MTKRSTEKPVSNEKRVPILIPASIVRWLETQGYSRKDLIEGSGLSEADIDSAEALVTPQQHRQLLLNALNLTNNPHIGLEIGKQFQVTTLGMVGLAAISSENILEAVQKIEKYIKLQAPLFEFKVEQADKHIHIFFSETQNLGPIRQLMYETLIAASVNSANYFPVKLSSEERAQIIFKVSLPEPDDKDIYNRALEERVNIQFDQKRNEIIIPIEYVLRSTQLVDLSVKAMSEEVCEEELQKLNKTVTIIRKLESLFERSEYIFPSLNEAASQLNISSRTFRRELQKQGTTYQTLLDKHRQTLAINLLRSSADSIQEIAIKLGFNEPTNFSRAFRKWSGKNPQHYRS